MTATKRHRSSTASRCNNNSTSATFSLVLSLLVLCVLPTLLSACYLWGTDSGSCIEESLDPIWRTDNIPFCSNVVTYPTCVPEYKTLPPSREFYNGRWTNHTISKKDRWVMDNFNLFVQERIALERNKTLRKMGKNEYGDIGKIIRRFNKRPDCQNAYKNLFCYLNFPRCDPARDLTLPTCRSACENFFKACAYERGLWRCGKSKYFNGYDPEPPVIGLDGNATYMRDYFPGQPWRQNKYTPGGSEHHICTPAILGAASRGINYASELVTVLVVTVASVSVLWMAL
jgi:hypothetical protein